jgi:multiple sugar transport system ATP-binding protein
MADVRIRQLHKRFPGGVHALSGIDMDVPDRQLTVLLGPSGCGKTTLLRMIAGFEEADAGSIEIGGEAMVDVRPRDRDLAAVFQEPALYPHMSVERNLGFALKIRQFPRSQINERVTKAADALGLKPVLKRYPHQLSLAERQRIAIGRALVRPLGLLLLDEPFAKIEPQRRDEMRALLKRLQQETAVTIICATDDPSEAMIIADHIALMRDGRIEQEGAPLQIFERPATRFAAALLGSPRMNFLGGVLARGRSGDAVQLTADGTSVPLPPNRLRDAVADGHSVILGIRPEHMIRAVRASPPDGTFRYEAVVELLQPTGTRTYVSFMLGGERVVAELNAHDASRPGERIRIDINLKRACIFDAQTERAL